MPGNEGIPYNPEKAPNVPEAAPEEQTEYQRYVEAYPLGGLDERVRKDFAVILREYAAVGEGIRTMLWVHAFAPIAPETDSAAQEVWHLARNNEMRRASLQGENLFSFSHYPQLRPPAVPTEASPTPGELADLIFVTTKGIYDAFKCDESGKVPATYDNKDGYEWFIGPGKMGKIPASEIIGQASDHAIRHAALMSRDLQTHGYSRAPQDVKNWG